ncbi:hypothetical protein ACQPYE_04245 [Actinosynnema sp. CA-299493]
MSGARRVGKVKVKKKCCRSTPRCKSCPVVVLLKAREKAAKKAAKQERKAQEGREERKKAGKKSGKKVGKGKEKASA